jgi:hypothetical protein
VHAVEEGGDLFQVPGHATPPGYQSGLDDYFEIVIDSSHNPRNAYMFQFNPLGTQRDALITNDKILKMTSSPARLCASEIDTLSQPESPSLPPPPLRFLFRH